MVPSVFLFFLNLNKIHPNRDDPESGLLLAWSYVDLSFAIAGWFLVNCIQIFFVLICSFHFMQMYVDGSSALLYHKDICLHLFAVGLPLLQRIVQLWFCRFLLVKNQRKTGFLVGVVMVLIWGTLLVIYCLNGLIPKSNFYGSTISSSGKFLYIFEQMSEVQRFQQNSH